LKTVLKHNILPSFFPFKQRVGGSAKGIPMGETTRAHDKTLVSLGFRGFFILSKKNRSISTTAFHMQVRILINYH